MRLITQLRFSLEKMSAMLSGLRECAAILIEMERLSAFMPGLSRRTAAWVS
jgi:hypothetical protein